MRSRKVKGGEAGGGAAMEGGGSTTGTELVIEGKGEGELAPEPGEGAHDSMTILL